MARFNAWARLPLFVSSTFRDMHAERDYLQNVVFPRLDEKLRERRRHLEPVDLRWGVETVSVEDQADKELQVLRVCLGEIERSRPFFLVLLGDRYGWVPPPGCAQAAAREQGFSTNVEGKSVTALEIEFGTLSSAAVRAHFFFRSLEAEMSHAETAVFRESDGEAALRLEELKDRLRERFPDRVHEYNARWDPDRRAIVGLEAFGEMVYKCLWRELGAATRHLATGAGKDWLDQERFELESFFAGLVRGFRGREQLCRELVGLALSTGPAWGACVVGESGSGKSSLLARVHQELQGTKHDGHEVLLLAHAAGISLRSVQVDSLLHRWCQELAEAVGVRPPGEAETGAALDRCFARLLEEAAGRRRVVLLLDALNQLEPTPRGRDLTWLPERWPANARLIVTATPGDAPRALARRDGVASRGLGLLTPDDARGLVQATCDRYHRSVSPKVREALLAKHRPDGSPSHGNPLWLEMAVEELNLLDAEDFALTKTLPETGAAALGEDERLEHLLLHLVGQMPPTVAELYGWLLDRSEEVVPRELARSFAGLVTLSRVGLRESDLAVLLPAAGGGAWEPLRFATLRRAFRAHLVQRGEQGQWDFFHEQMRQAVVRRNLGDPERVAELHRIIADHLVALPADDPLRQSEAMYHLLGQGDRLRAADYYTAIPDPEVLRDPEVAPLVPGERRAQVLDRWREATAATEVIADFLLGTLPLDALPGRTPDLDARLNWVLSWAPTLKEMFEMVGKVQSGPGLDVVKTENGMVISGEIPGLKDNMELWPLLSKFLISLYAELERRGAPPGLLARLAGRLQAVTEQMKLSPAFLGERYYPAMADFRRGEAARQQADAENVSDEERAQLRQQALEAYLAGDAIFSEMYRLMPNDAEAARGLAVSREKLGDLLQELNHLDEAVACYEMSCQLRERLDRSGYLAGRLAFQRDLMVIYERLGGAYRRQGELQKALESYQQALQAARRWQQSEELLPDIVLLQHCLGETLLELERPGEAVRELTAALEVARRLNFLDPSNSRWQGERISLEILLGRLTVLPVVLRPAPPLPPVGPRPAPPLPPATPATPSTGELLRRVSGLLTEGRAEEALRLLPRTGGNDPLTQNARAGCLLRLGQPGDALVILRGLVLRGGIFLRPDAPVAFKNNYVLALLATGNLDGASRTLSDMESAGGNEATEQIRRHVVARQQRGSLLGRLSRWLTGRPAPSVPALPPGEVLVE
jgi:tetratricopeptide (TPR) repeat protein